MYKEGQLVNDELAKLQKGQKQVFDLDKHILTNNIYGVDLNEESVQITKLSLWLKTANKEKELTAIDNNIKCGNSLIDDPNIAGNKAFKWKEEFREIISNKGFDIVIGNPPWVFTRGQKFLKQIKDYFYEYLINQDLKKIKKAKNIQSGKINLYGWFIIRSLELLSDRSFFSFIIPNNILRTTTYDLIRKYILDNCKIISIIDLGTNIFENVTASAIILVLRKEKNPNNRMNNLTKIVYDIKNKNINNFKEHFIEQKSFYKNISYTFNIYSDSKSLKLSTKIKTCSINLGNISKYIIEGIVCSIKKDVFEEKKDSGYKPFLTGKDIKKYYIDYKNKYIRYDKNLLHRSRPEEVFLSDKIIIQRISGGNSPLTAALDKNQFYTFASINNIVLNNNNDFILEYILALINSKLMNWYYAINFSNKSNLTVNVSKTYLEQLPIKELSTDIQNWFKDKVDSIINKKNEIKNFLSKTSSFIINKFDIKDSSLIFQKQDKTSWQEFLTELQSKKVILTIDKEEELKNWFENKIEQFKKIKEEINNINDEIDKKIYTIYDLAEEEIEIIEN